MTIEKALCAFYNKIIHNQKKVQVLTMSIHQNKPIATANFEDECAFGNAMKELGVSALLKASNITKAKGASAYELFQFLVILVFQKRNLYHFLNSKKKDTAYDDNTYYRFLNEGRYNWRKFILLLSARIAAYFTTLTRENRARCFVLDDSVIARNRSKKVELLSNVYNHVIHRTERGFNLLLLGWTDGYSFLPVQYIMLASAKAKSRICDVYDKHLRHNTNAYKRRVDAITQKPVIALQLLRFAIDADIKAEYVLMDTWFTTEPFICSIKDLGLEVIGMLKDTKQQYWYKGRLYNLKGLAKIAIRHCPQGNLFGSIVVKTKYQQLPVKLVFVRNRNKKDEYIILLTTAVTLPDSEAVRIYGYRWGIEVCFRACKSLLKLGKEFQGLSYDVTDSTTALVLTRFLILEYIRRRKNDPKTICELFFVCCDDIQDISLKQSIDRLAAMLIEGVRTGDVSIQISEKMRSDLTNWFSTQPEFIQNLFRDFLNLFLTSDKVA